jgi:hypothetical protein
VKGDVIDRSVILGKRGRGRESVALHEREGKKERRGARLEDFIVRIWKICSVKRRSRLPVSTVMEVEDRLYKLSL